MSNVHDPKFREAKPRQGGSSISTADLFRLDGRTVLVTGGVGFLGVTLTETIIESGGDVVCFDRIESPPKDVWEPLENIAQKYSASLSYYSVDVTDPAMVANAFEKFIPALRYPLRGFVSCAGISLNGPSVEFPIASFQKLMDINVTGTFVVAQAVAREMMRTGNNGSMVLTASMSGTVVNRGVDTAGYNSSKSAVLQLARSLAAEWGSRVGMPLIRVNTLSPGYIRTAATAEALSKPGMEAQWEGDNMLYRLSYPDEFRGPVLMMLSDAGSFMTGADLRVDGGHCAW